ncbi:WD40 repeat-like protein [Coccomyxa subellipsoidea C-169]|uniref:WD40 repeat-like protein n=1 Tax=Coccomyxa subellipsoidea (strain C-169) TaxID=574566 RepID=I0Z427_COCSC|nr:WD40 repeat-like protein [Coccomyxa subellipsoidea C-169]EIE25396.1 WD40 repeat-like protein [Coccomyxa subellipsoidea C-169]|eukprot:XP_005649940.1 WD40 repeat-like protein [Coccomyxa subellipsoidea C-169]
MISALCWIAREAAKDVPVLSEPTEEELKELKEAALAGAGDEDDDEIDADEEDTSDDEDMDEAAQVEKAKAMAEMLRPSGGGNEDAKASTSAGLGNIDAAMAELDMEHYDDEEGDVPGLFGTGKHPGMAYHSRAEDDPYLAKDISDSDDEELTLKKTDFLILAARNEDDVSHLEVWVYEDMDETGESNLYVHHDIILPAFPLSLAWMDCNLADTTATANLAAVGSISPAIEIWDLDVLDAVEPLVTLGGEAPAASTADGSASEGAAIKKKKKKSKKKGLSVKEGSHEDAVLGLSWNRDFRNVLASASADKTVKVWDVASQQCQHTLTHHKGKVQAVAWNPAEAPVLLSGAFDKVAALADVRVPDGQPLTWKVSADVEALTWSPHAPTTFLVSSEDGLVSAYDARGGAGSEPLFRLAAHDAATCALSFNPAAPNLLATASTDNMVKLWDVADNKPSLVAAQDLKVGACFTAAFCREAPWLLAAAGAAGTVAVWDVLTNAAVSNRYNKHLRRQTA